MSQHYTFALVYFIYPLASMCADSVKVFYTLLYDHSAHQCSSSARLTHASLNIQTPNPLNPTQTMYASWGSQEFRERSLYLASVPN
jgi:hypothetical protein